jgi:polar amino acid transport system substrate-binding protein
LHQQKVLLNLQQCAMKMWMVWLLFLGSLLSLAPASATAVEPDPSAKVVTIAAEDNWPPFSNDQGLGLSYTLVQAALEQSGYQLKTIVVPYARALYSIENHMVDGCWNVTKQTSTSSRFLLHQVPLFRARSSFYYYKTPKAFTSLKAMPNRTVVGVILGYEYGDEFEQHKHRFHLVEVSSHQQLVKLLQAGKLDVALFFDDVLSFYLKQMQLNDPLIIKGAENLVSEIYIAFDKKNEQSQRKADALDHGLRQLQQSGAYQKLMDEFQAGMRAN